MPSKTKAPAKRSAPTETKPKTQARSQDSQKLDFKAEAVTFPTDEANEALEAERDELQQPGQVSGKVAKQIDNDPGYDIDQLSHMVEYWGDDERDEPGK